MLKNRRTTTRVPVLVGVVGLLVAVVIVFGRTDPDPPPSAGPASTVRTLRGRGSAPRCRGIQVPAGSNLRSAVENAPGGTTFCLAPGMHEVHSPIFAKSHDTLIGTAPRRDGVTVKTTSAQIVFHLPDTTGVTFKHFAITGAINACPGANCGETGRAISSGIDVTITDMHLYGNGLNGVGGTGDGLVVRNSEIDHNGAVVSGDDGVSGGIKQVNSLTVTGSYIHDNQNNGVWCDIQCGAFIVRANKITNNTGNGVFMEISKGPAVIANNLIEGNNSSSWPGKGGISILDSRNVAIRENVVTGNRGFDIGAQVDDRVNCGRADEQCGFQPLNVSVTQNILDDRSVLGCDLSGVECATNS